MKRKIVQQSDGVLVFCFRLRVWELNVVSWQGVAQLQNT